MRKFRIAMSTLALATMLSVHSATSAFAAPPEPNAFVCPVLRGQAGDAHSQSNPDPIVTIGGSDASFNGPSVSRSVHATNQDGQEILGRQPTQIRRCGLQSDLVHA
jgi:hypothetical protein